MTSRQIQLHVLGLRCTRRTIAMQLASLPSQPPKAHAAGNASHFKTGKLH